MQRMFFVMLLAGISLLMTIFTRTAIAQDGANSGVFISTNRQLMNQNTVKIVSGKSSGTLLPIVEDMATVLDDGDKLRILAIIGKGSAQNVADTLFLKGIDMGITHANVLAYFKKLPGIGRGLENRLVFITTLFNEEVHIIAAAGTTDIAQLIGKTVNFGEPGTGTSLTAKAIFSALKVNVRPVFLAQADALEKLRKGEIAATVLLAGKPAGALRQLRDSADFALVPIPFEEALENDYLPSTLSSKDYPDLIADGSEVDTIAVPAVLAAYNWQPGGDRHRRLATFVDAFFGKFAQFRKEPRHPKWREVNIYAPLRGWKRLPYAQQWLNEHKPRGVARRKLSRTAKKATFRDFIGGKKTPATAEPTRVDQALYREFLRWKKSRGGAAAGVEVPTAARKPDSGAGRKGSAGGRLW